MVEITINDFKPINYTQTGDYCVLASYAIAAYPYTGRKVLEYFEDFCKHYGINTRNNDFESMYLDKFRSEYEKPGMNGYLVIKKLHETSSQTSFKEARTKFNLEYIDDAMVEMGKLEDQLKRKKDILLNVFINTSAHNQICEMHSITIGYDHQGYFIYDVNKGSTNRLIDSLGEIGELGNAFVFSKKKN